MFPYFPFNHYSDTYLSYLFIYRTYQTYFARFYLNYTVTYLFKDNTHTMLKTTILVIVFVLPVVNSSSCEEAKSNCISVCFMDRLKCGDTPQCIEESRQCYNRCDYCRKRGLLLQ